MRLREILVSLFILSLSIISTTFVLLTLTSKDWAIQEYYKQPEGAGITTWDASNLICTAYRSPFYRCGSPVITQDPNNPQNWTCDITCAWYKPYGFGETSCVLPVETGVVPSQDPVPSKQECQEVHYAGDLQIAAAFFTTFGLIVLLSLTMVNIILAAVTTDTNVEETHGERPKHEDAQERVPPPATRQHRLRRSRFAPYCNLFLVVCLCAGAACQFIAQFFGTLGLTLNATATPTFYIQQSGVPWGVNAWIMSTALTKYATVSWTMSLACAVLVAGFYRLPRFPKLV